MKRLIWIIFLFVLTSLKAVQIEPGLRLQANSYKYYFNPTIDQMARVNSFSPGLSLQIKTSSTTFLRFGLLPQKRNYSLQYNKTGATMLSANLQLTESELSFGKYFFSHGEDKGLYLNTGLQTLWRNWGEETYQEDIIANTYWPATRVSIMLGGGYSFYTSESMKINLGIGMNTFLGPQMAFETATHHYFFYLIINGISHIKSANPIHKKCPNQF